MEKIRAEARTTNEYESLSDIRLLLSPAQIAFHDARGEFAAAGVKGDAFGQLRELIDEADPFHSPVVFDQGERADTASLADRRDRLLQCRERAALIGRIKQINKIALDVSRRLAVCDDENLFVLARALAKDPSGQLQTHVQIREVLRRLAS